MNSTTRFHAKPKPEAFASPFESRVLDSSSHASPTSNSPSIRRSAKRWARKPTLPSADNPHSDQEDNDAHVLPPASALPAIHPLESLVESLYSPAAETEEQRMGEYEWYIHYPSDPASHAVEMMDEKDLGLYLRQSRLAQGEEVERLLVAGVVDVGVGLEGGGSRGGGEDEERRAGFYEGWLRTAS